MIKATLLTPNLTVGGAERWVVDMVKHSPKQLKWQNVVVSGFGGVDESLLRELKPHTTLLRNQPAGPANAYTEYFEKIPPDSGLIDLLGYATRDSQVLVTWGSCDLEFLFKKVSPKVKRVLCAHTTLQEATPAPVTGITHLTAVSEAALAGFYKGRPGTGKLPKQVIYNGVSAERVTPTQSFTRISMREQWGFPPNAYVIGYIGRQSSEKNFMAAAEAARHGGKEIYVVYVGGKPHTDKIDETLKSYCAQYLPGRHKLIPPTTEIADILCAMDCLMLASAREAFSLVLIEAWLAGIPVIATPVGSVPELEKLFGLLVFRVPANPQPNHLIYAVASARFDKGERARYAKKVAEQHLTAKVMTNNWANYLQKVVTES